MYFISTLEEKREKKFLCCHLIFTVSVWRFIITVFSRFILKSERYNCAEVISPIMKPIQIGLTGRYD
jgi:uncharacterized protein YggT (Ycf19 family)